MTFSASLLYLDVTLPYLTLPNRTIPNLNHDPGP